MENAVKPLNLPLLLKWQRGNRLQRTVDLIALINEKLDAGWLTSPEFTQIKEINRMIEYAVDAISNFYISDKSSSYFQLETYGLGVHNIRAKLKKAEAFNDEFAQQYKALLTELIPLQDAAAVLKGNIKAKEVIAAEKAAEKDAKKQITMDHGDVKKVEKLLRDTVKDLYDEVLSENTKYVKELIATWEKQYDPAIAKTAPNMFYAKQPTYRTITNDATVAVEQNKKVTYKVRDDFESVVAKWAKHFTEKVFALFINRGIEKLSPILIRKNNMKAVQLLGAEFRSGSIEAHMKMEFEDGAYFYVKTGTVFSVSKLGNFFYRFPMLFRNVVLSDGTSLARPSEDRMSLFK